MRLVFICAFLIGATFAESCAAGSGVSPEIISHQVICRQPNRYIGWPTIAKTKAAELLIVFSGDRDGHVCPWGKTQMVRSLDSGRTWSEPLTINNTPLDDRDSGIIETKNGTLMVSWFTSLAFENTKNNPWQRHSDKIGPETRQKWLGSWIRRSADEGKSWQEPVRVPVSAPHGPIELHNGKLLYVGTGQYQKKRVVAAAESCDDGLSWQVIGTVPISPEEIKYFAEPHSVQLDDGRIITMMRNGKDGFLRQSESLDGGKTWLKVHSNNIWGYPPHLIKLRDSRLLVTYGRRKQPFGQRACISDDNGETWDLENEIIINDAPNKDLGYPASVQLDDGSILTIYYQQAKAGEKTCLMGTHWRLRDDSSRSEIQKVEN